MRLDLKENIVFPFSDPEWAIKLLKTSLCYLFVLPAPAVMGYQLAVIREAANGEDSKLPEFGSDFGSMWVKGFLISVVLGLLILVPTMGIGALTYGAVMAMGDDQGQMVLLIGLAMVLFLLACLLLGVLMPALLLRYAMTDQFSSLFDIGAAISDIKQGPGDYALIFFFPLIASIVSTLVSATGVGAILVLPLTVLTMIIQGRMIGNYYRAYFH